MNIVKVEENGIGGTPGYICFAVIDGKNATCLVEIWRARLKRDPRIVEGCVTCLPSPMRHYVSFKWPVEDQLPTLKGLDGPITPMLAKPLIEAALKYRREQAALYRRNQKRRKASPTRS